MTEETLTLALLQKDLQHLAREENLEGFGRMMDGLPERVGLIVLPETFNHGFITDGELRSEPHMGLSVEWMRRRAALHGALVCGTLATEDGGKLYNRFYFAFPDGEVEWYDKLHLFSLAGEDERFTAGSERKRVTFRGWRICPQVCYDVRFPEAARNHDGYDLLLYAASWPASRDPNWRTLLDARAIENQCYLGGCNRVGTDAQGILYRGSSKIVAPSGKTLAELPPEQEGVVLADLSYSRLQQVREKYPFLREACWERGC
ncbi:MAG: nitrilase family protein [Bacteroidia bacterium]|nr:MAG: nitrilase family protein [Bacteroidia bacterium]